MTVDYKSTIFLPQTGFQMKAGLTTLEPKLLERWAALDLYQRQREQAKGREKFILHDGPPYANGNVHVGTALNKILKDVIVRSRQMLGFDSNYVPGWDCHGLPIEWKIEEQYRAKKQNKDDIPIVEFRQECRDFANHWIDVQRAEFKRLGVIGDWDNPYTTMSYAAEAQIVRELGKFLMDGSLYKGAKPVLWSVVEKTALAEAEVEYHDHTSTTVYVRFPVVTSFERQLRGASILIWTTTPWTLPGNRAIAYGKEIEYGLYEVKTTAKGSLAEPGERLVVATALAEATAEAAGITQWIKVADIKNLEGTECAHPFFDMGYDGFDVPLLAGDFVDMETGTGFVHIAPGHGADDWELGVKHGLPIIETVDDGGLFNEQVPLFAGKHIFKVAPEIVQALAEAGKLLASGKLVHSYPHSWRSKAPLIFRTTPQWFISMEKTDLRAKAMKAIEETQFVPAKGRNRLQGMVETRPDWCVSRQRAWGVPITVFVDKQSGEPLRDPAVLERIVAAVEAEGADAWFASDPARFLGSDYDPDAFEQVTDILDVWFDSGTTHSFVLETRPDLQWPASLYLEGSDQHRGWFQSSLLESCGTRGRAPYDAILTHGFIMVGDQKMSKSLGNFITSADMVDKHGADILRLWVAGSDYTNDLHITPEIMKSHSDVYRRLRNTLRYLLGNLNGFEESERLAPAQMPELERWALHRLWEIDGKLRAAYERFEFHLLFTELHAFCTNDLSAFYFDVRKDNLYCDRPDSPERRAARTVLDSLFDCLTAWLAPFLCFTAEEAWLERHPGDGESVHLRLFPEIPADWRDDALAAKWSKVRAVRRVVTGALEIARAEKKIGSSLAAAPRVFLGGEDIAALADVDLAEIAITSGITLIEGPAPEGAFRLDDVVDVGVVIEIADGEKCERCWKVLDDVGSDHDFLGVCGRCADAVRRHPAAA
jgi:isoleucyl-tRNA synthetase